MDIITRSESGPLGSLIQGAEWHDRAACRGQPTDIFFSEAEDDIKKAKEICMSCERDVRISCLQTELDVKESRSEHGLFGGMTPRERANLRRNLWERQRSAKKQGLPAPSFKELLESLF